jgi:O-antigen ligase
MPDLIGLIGLGSLGLLIFALPEVGLVLCAVAAPLAKGVVQPYLGPVDLTVFLFLATSAAVFVRLSVQRERIPLPPHSLNLAAVVFAAFLSVGFLRSPLPEYGIQILVRFLLFDLMMLYLVVAWAHTRVRTFRLLALFTWGGLAYGLLLLLNVAFAGRGSAHLMRIYGVFEGTAPLAVALVLGTCLILALAFWLAATVRLTRRAILTVIALVTIQLVATNARGPLVGFAGGAIVWGLLSMRSFGLRRLAAPTSTVLFSGAFALKGLPLLVRNAASSETAVAGAARISEYVWRHSARFALNPDASSVSARVGAWAFVAENFREWFLSGAGLFGFAHEYHGTAEGLTLSGSYPHNLLLDVFSNVGFFGAMVFLALITLPIFHGLQAARRGDLPLSTLTRGAIAAYCCFLVASTFSFGLIETRLLFFLGGTLIALSRAAMQEDLSCGRVLS